MIFGIHCSTFFQQTSSFPKFHWTWALVFFTGINFRYTYWLHLLVMRIHFNKNSIFPTQQTHQGWYLVENESWADVHLSTLFQRWQNSVETSLIELRGFNVDEPTLFQRWNLIENESWADVCLSTLFQRWQSNVETRLIELRWFHADDDPMLFQHWY